MRFEEYIKEEEQMLILEGVFQKILGKIANKPINKVKNIFQEHWRRLANLLQKQDLENDALRIINKQLGTHFRSLDQITKADIAKMPAKLTEDFAHYWGFLKDNAFTATLIFSGLQIFFELDKLIKTQEPDFKTLIVYAAMWVVLVSGKYIKDYIHWKKQNPEEFEREGRPGLIRGPKFK